MRDELRLYEAERLVLEWISENPLVTAYDVGNYFWERHMFVGWLKASTILLRLEERSLVRASPGWSDLIPGAFSTLEWSITPLGQRALDAGIGHSSLCGLASEGWHAATAVGRRASRSVVYYLLGF